MGARENDIFLNFTLDKLENALYNTQAFGGNAAIAQPVERILGKDEVASSNLASSSIFAPVELAASSARVSGFKNEVVGVPEKRSFLGSRQPVQIWLAAPYLFRQNHLLGFASTFLYTARCRLLL